VPVWCRFTTLPRAMIWPASTQGPGRQISKSRSKGWCKGRPRGRQRRYYPITGIDEADTDNERMRYRTDIGR